MILIAYLRIVAAGVTSRVWRTLAGRPCPCESCRAHQAFVRRTQADYDAEVLGHTIDLHGGPIERRHR